MTLPKPPFVSPTDTSLGTFDYPSPGFYPGDELAQFMTKVIAPKNGYDGNYGGFHFEIGAGSAVTFLADGAAMPTGEGAAAILKNPLSGPDQGAEVTPVAVTLPATPGPLDVTAVDLPDVTVTGPAGATFDINVLTGLATPIVPSPPSPSAAPSP